MSHTAAPLHKRSNSQDSNTAGIPLPRIPRRSSSSRMPSTPTAKERFFSPLTQIQQPTPPGLDFSKEIDAILHTGGVPFPRTPSAEPSQLTIRARRLQRHGIEDVDPTSPTPEYKQKKRRELPDEFLGVLSPPSTSVSLDSLIPMLEFPASAPIPTSKSFSALHYCPPTLYTKSGRPIKSSLKGSKPKGHADLVFLTGHPATNSEPVTPKAVHFDAQLEQVKLFLSAQKPAAVSRNGSPTDDTSGNESSDFPGLSVDEQEIIIHSENMPDVVNRQADLAVQDIKMMEDNNIGGSIRVRNLAFQKWVAVRFTFDTWQTTSEVAARYATTEDLEFDIFSFTIKLADTLTRIEEKTLVLAIHYRVNGGDIWDNNGGQNYIVKFSRVPKPLPVQKARLKRMPSSEDEGVSSDDLRNRLEKVVRSRGVIERPNFLRRQPADRSPSRSRSPSPVNAVDGFPTTSQPIPRYEFNLKQPWDGATRARVATYPMAASPPSTIPFPSTKRQASFPPSCVSLVSPKDTKVVPVIVPRTNPTESIPPHVHHEGFFDGLFQDVNKDTDRLPSNRQLFSLDGSKDSMLEGLGLTPLEHPGVLSRHRLEEGASEDSTPPIMSPSWSPSSSPSPTESIQGEQSVPGGSPRTSYRHFVNKFCFFTGSGDMQFLSPETMSLTSSLPSAETLTSFASTGSVAIDDPLNELSSLRGAYTTPTLSSP